MGTSNFAYFNLTSRIWYGSSVSLEVRVWTMFVNGSTAYLGGDFASKVAKFNIETKTISPVGFNVGIDATVHAICVWKAELFAAGGFQSELNSNVIVFRNNLWIAMQGSPNGTVLTMTGNENFLYFGGYFLKTQMGLNCAWICSWNESTWSSVGNSIDSPVQSMITNGSDLLVVGSFGIGDLVRVKSIMDILSKCQFR